MKLFDCTYTNETVTVILHKTWHLTRWHHLCPPPLHKVSWKCHSHCRMFLYAYIHIHTHIYLYDIDLCIYAGIHIHIYLHNTCIYTCINAHTRSEYVYFYMCIYIYMCVCVNTCILHACIYACMHTCIHKYKVIHISINKLHIYIWRALFQNMLSTIKENGLAMPMSSLIIMF